MLTQDDTCACVTLVDDEPWALDVLVRATRMWNFDCQAASTAEQALGLLEKHQTPIVVTDIRMPGRGGVWLVREVQRRWPHIGIIVITAGHDQDAVNECMEAGAHHYFLKPINLDEFHHALVTSTRNYRQQNENHQYRRFLEKRVHKQTRRIRQTFLSAIDSLVRTLEARDSYTSGHSLRVRGYAVDLARNLGVAPEQLKQISVAAKLHDIGKVGLPEAILNKAGALTADEYQQVQQHPEIGERILTPIIRNRRVLAAIRSHHERWDGNGYPDRLSGESIPVSARIISVADCFDALTSSRAYREAMTVAEALDILLQGSGHQFDPAFVLPFVNMIRQLPADFLETLPSRKPQPSYTI
jgi:putative two-component system response regulator